MRHFLNVVSPLLRHQLTTESTRVFSSSTVVSKSASPTEQYPAGWDTARPYNEIPGPSKLKLLSWMLPGGPLQHPDSMHILRFLRDEYGPLAKLPGLLGKQDMVFTTDPKHFETILATQGNWPVRRAFQVFTHYCKDVRPDLFKGMAGILNDQGEPWYKLRKEINPLMQSPKTVRTYMPAVDEVARDFVSRMGDLRDEKGEMPDNFMDELGAWALEAVGLMALDRRLGALRSDRSGDEAKRLIKALHNMVRLLFIVEMKPPLWYYYKTKDYRDFVASLDIITEFIKNYIDEAKAALELKQKNGLVTEENSNSVLQQLLKKDPLYAFLAVYDLFIAGNDTTSSAMGTLLYYLAANQDKQEILREEVFRILPEVTTEMTPENYAQFRYFRACMKESLRMQPQIPRIPRSVADNIVLNGYRIPKNTEMIMSIYLVQTSDEHFTRSAEFLPERWMRETVESKPNNPYLYLPFGSGIRACVGKRFAEMEMLILAARILREYRLEWHYEPAKFVSSFILVPETNLNIRLVKL